MTRLNQKYLLKHTHSYQTIFRTRSRTDSPNQIKCKLDQDTDYLFSKIRVLQVGKPHLGVHHDLRVGNYTTVGGTKPINVSG